MIVIQEVEMAYTNAELQKRWREAHRGEPQTKGPSRTELRALRARVAELEAAPKAALPKLLLQYEGESGEMRYEADYDDEATDMDVYHLDSLLDHLNPIHLPHLIRLAERYGADQIIENARRRLAYEPARLAAIKADKAKCAAERKATKAAVKKVA
jgi:hypothetical protein